MGLVRAAVKVYLIWVAIFKEAESPIYSGGVEEKL